MFNIGLEPRAGVTNDQMYWRTTRNMLSCASSCFNGVHCNLIAFIKLLLRHSLGHGKYLPFTKGVKRFENNTGTYTGKCSRLLYVMSCSISDFPSRSPEERPVNRPTFTDAVSCLLIISCCNYEPIAAKKGLFPTSMNDFGLVGIWHLTQLLTTSRGAENLKLYFYRPLSTPFNFIQFSYIIFPFPNVRPSILPSPTLFPAQSKPKLLTSHRLWRRVSARMAISRR